MIKLPGLYTASLVTGLSIGWAAGIQYLINESDASDFVKDCEPLAQETQDKVNELALRMGLSSHVDGYQTQMESCAIGSDLPYSYPMIVWNKDRRPFDLAHELAHVRLRHTFRDSFLNSLVGLSIFCVLKSTRPFWHKANLKGNLAASLIAITTSKVFAYMLRIQSEQEADLMACDYVNKNEIAQFMRHIDIVKGSGDIALEFASYSLVQDIRTRWKFAKDPHPSHTSRLAYLEKAYDQKGPASSLKVKITDQPAAELDSESIEQLFSQIKLSSRRYSLIDLVEIRYHPQSERNNLDLICSDGTTTSFHVTQASVADMLKEALAQPVKYILSVKTEKEKEIMKVAIDRLPQFGRDEVRYNPQMNAWEVAVFFKDKSA